MFKLKVLFLALFLPFIGFSQNEIYVNVMLGGIDPYTDSIPVIVENFMFDTGASISAITPQTYNNLKNINAITSSSNAVLIKNADGRIVEMEIGVITFLGLTPNAIYDNIPVVILPEGSTDNLLGIDIISKFNSIEINFINRTILWE